jgi:hypothetical protein
MLHNFTFLEFYKDLQAYVTPRLALGDETALVTSHLMLQKYRLQEMQINLDQFEALPEPKTKH